MQIRDRIKAFIRVRAADLRPNPRNWRTHPSEQQDALRGLLAEIGYASALLVRELPDGTLELLDGHLRAETTPDTMVPVLVLDLDDAEAAKLLATFDPVSAMAGIDRGVFDQLLPDVMTNCDAVRTLLEKLQGEDDSLAEMKPGMDAAAEKAIPEVFQVVIECEDEAEQHEVYERLTAEGRTCKLRML